ncbi:hypothetical protein KY290_014510 [Solanum tuberosum]|uniref:DUF1985 domain-containing protein n=1 Tax=Solanum tuberosum TaxID=4113 RepID=A0ABQ7VPW8_SOLTU|nr:hypothetical protein KY289_014565 [Solanum tuberosum]KAH0770529.1 hypothetical protein KY290_014510 [Solanum tuberosum]
MAHWSMMRHIQFHKPIHIHKCISESKKPSPRVSWLKSLIIRFGGDNDDDAVKFAILFYIHSFILSEEPTTTVIDRKDFDLVESGRYIDYPWGKKAFDLLILHLHTKIKHDGKYFRLYGFPLALQVWFYECCSNFDEESDVKVCDHIPRILNWKTKKDFPRLSYFAKGMFRDDNNPVRTLVFKNITPTPMELKILELPFKYVQSYSSPTETTTANASDDDHICIKHRVVCNVQ